MPQIYSLLETWNIHSFHFTPLTPFNISPEFQRAMDRVPQMTVAESFWLTLQGIFGSYFRNIEHVERNLLFRNVDTCHFGYIGSVIDWFSFQIVHEKLIIMDSNSLLLLLLLLFLSRF